MSRRIVVVEDDAHIRMGVAEALSGEGYEVIECDDGGLALALITESSPALVILDVMLPQRSGFDVCRDLRAKKNPVPVLMLTAKGEEIDKVVGLEIGADDYVTKPFGVRELLARVHALLRRAGIADEAFAGAPEVIEFGDVSVRTRVLRGRRGEVEFSLTPRELAVLALLYRERGNAVSRDRILNEVWGIDYYGTTRTLDQVVVKLRQKVEAEPARPEHLLTVHGLGYRLE